MPTFDDILRIHRLQRVELQAWIEQRWVRPLTTLQASSSTRPTRRGSRLIRELRQEFLVDDDALEVVLPLLDQLYATRRVLKRVEEARRALPPEAARGGSGAAAAGDEERSG